MVFSIMMILFLRWLAIKMIPVNFLNTFLIAGICIDCAAKNVYILGMKELIIKLFTKLRMILSVRINGKLV